MKLRKIRTLRSKQVRRAIRLRSVCVFEAAKARRGRPGDELAKIQLVLLFLRHTRARISAPSSGTRHHKPNTRAPDMQASAPLSLGVERRAQASAKNRRSMALTRGTRSPSAAAAGWSPPPQPGVPTPPRPESLCSTLLALSLARSLLDVDRPPPSLASAPSPDAPPPPPPSRRRATRATSAP